MELVAPPGFRTEIPYLRAQWRENLAVEIHCRVLPWAEFVDRLRDSPSHLVLSAWGPDSPDPDTYLRVAVRRHTSWRDEAYFSLVERARRALTLAERLELYGQAELRLVEQVPLLPLSYARLHLLVKPWVRRYLSAVTGTVFWKDAIIEPH